MSTLELIAFHLLDMIFSGQLLAVLINDLEIALVLFGLGYALPKVFESR